MHPIEALWARIPRSGQRALRRRYSCTISSPRGHRGRPVVWLSWLLRTASTPRAFRQRKRQASAHPSILVDTGTPQPLRGPGTLRQGPAWATHKRGPKSERAATILLAFKCPPVSSAGFLLFPAEGGARGVFAPSSQSFEHGEWLSQLLFAHMKS